jgi:hypothetical protein
MKKVTADIADLKGILERFRVAYNAVECMFDFGFTKRYFDDPKYGKEFYKDKARIQYYILGGNIVAMGDTLMELDKYIKELENDKDKG